MAKIKIINPETAAHNIANAFSEKYVKSLNNTKALSLDGPLLYDAAKRAAEIYTHTYDEAFDYFSKENKQTNPSL